MFETITPEDTSFPHAYCAHCDREVLVYQTLNEQGELLPSCLDCDTPLAHLSPESWSTEDLVDQGYALEGHRGDSTPGGCGGSHCSS